MRPFKPIDGIAAPIPQANIDTDKILPGRFLKTITREGLGRALFDTQRFDEAGQERPDFVLNRVPYRQAEILIALENFGCGSSREHAPWALADFGIRAIVAPSFADIFRNNCIKNGILPIALPRSDVDRLIVLASSRETARMRIDLEAGTLVTVEGSQAFEIDDGSRERLLRGLDEIGLSLRHGDAIDRFELQRDGARWLFPLAPVTF